MGESQNDTLPEVSDKLNDISDIELRGLSSRKGRNHNLSAN